MNTSLTEAYINLKYSAYTADACKAVMKQAIEVIEACKARKSEIIGSKYKSRMDVSQLDLADMWQSKAEAVYDNATKMIGTVAR